MTLIQALIEYGLFAAKALTLVLAIGLLAVMMLRARQGSPSDEDDDGSRLEVVDLNHRYAQMADRIKAAILPPKVAKKAFKAERKLEKAKAKAEQPDQRRLFVIDFHGDLMATEVGALREVISALLMTASTEDEVLVRLDNAGGAVHEHGLAASQLLRLRTAGIPLTIAVDKVAASGGYLMACVANRIIAAPFAVVGSIGVLAEMPNFHRLLQQKGVDFELHTAGEHKRTLTLFGENTDEGRAKLREQLEETHGQFKSFIAAYRPDLDLSKVATGEYWHGEQALSLGLVDGVQTSDDYLLSAREEASLYKIRYRAHKRPLERLLGSVGFEDTRAGVPSLGSLAALLGRRIGRWMLGRGNV
ncbi:protease SohB [Lamprobacter modestohalophilus]|uniref:protease SohB n=1 Tax=Lamprobacter modestohalophilus TaxID=1064514 RepID=UPI002ADEAFE9|nr:protease SohB [Lamprobacter modestohalophilus]MEA1050042.1 protease SohB [Lamprobacter modestohalophilus]